MTEQLKSNDIDQKMNQRLNSVGVLMLAIPSMKDPYTDPIKDPYFPTRPPKPDEIKTHFPGANDPIVKKPVPKE